MSKFTLLFLIAITLSLIQTGSCKEEKSKPSKGVAQRYSRNSHIEVMKRRLTNVWNLVSKQFSNPNPDTFIGKRNKAQIL